MSSPRRGELLRGPERAVPTTMLMPRCGPAGFRLSRLVAVLALLLLPACPRAAREAPASRSGAEPAPQRPDRVTLVLPVTDGTREVVVELALTEAERNTGLMNRTQLDTDAGMLFLFPDERPRTFWMKNTLLPLDILFLDSDGRVQNVARAQPGVEKPGYHSLRPARMVLELNQGWCEEHGLGPGAIVPVAPELLALATK